MKTNFVPNRRCVGCMKTFLKKDLDRYVNVDKKSFLDNEKKMNGRGVYVCKGNDECLKKAIKKGRIYE